MGRFKVRYLVAKQQKGHILYYWQPKKELQEYGFATRRLAEATNTLEDAVKEAEALNKELDVWRKTGQDPNTRREGTIEWLTDKYRKSQWYKSLAPKTQKGYEHWLKRIENYAGKSQISAFTRAVCKALYNSLAEKSLHNANATLRVVRLLFTFAIDEGIITENPAKGIRLVSTKSRDQVWPKEALEMVVTEALRQNRRSIALAIKIAENLGQREGDVLKAKRTQYNGETIKIRQNKTGAYIEVKCSQELKRWLDETPEHEYLVVNETTKKPYKEDNFRHLFAEIRDAVKIDGLWFMDLRRTAVVRLAEAGCTIPEIAAITGHAIATCQKILEVYLPRNAVMAANAIDKLEDYKKKLEGLKKAAVK